MRSPLPDADEGVRDRAKCHFEQPTARTVGHDPLAGLNEELLRQVCLTCRLHRTILLSRLPITSNAGGDWNLRLKKLCKSAVSR